MELILDSKPLVERMAKIEALLDEATPGGWRVVPSERPTLYTEISEGAKSWQEVNLGGYMGTGCLAEFGKYPKAWADSELAMELRNGASELVTLYKQHLQMVAILQHLTPVILHGDLDAMIKWLEEPY